MAAVSVLLISPFAFQGSAPGWALPHSGDSGAQRSDSPRVAGADHCAHARKAVRFYLRRANDWRERMGAGELTTPAPSARRDRACPHVRRLAEVWRKPEEWVSIAASARVPGARKVGVSCYLAERASDEVLAGIAEGAA